MIPQMTFRVKQQNGPGIDFLVHHPLEDKCHFDLVLENVDPIPRFVVQFFQTHGRREHLLEEENYWYLNVDDIADDADQYEQALSILTRAVVQNYTRIAQSIGPVTTLENVLSVLATAILRSRPTDTGDEALLPKDETNEEHPVE